MAPRQHAACYVAARAVCPPRQVWDVRTKQQVHILAGHTNTVVAIGTQDADPQVVTGAMDSTIRHDSPRARTPPPRSDATACRLPC